MFNPPHPASILREDISPELALRLEQWLGNTTAETWLKMQLAFDLWRVQQKGLPKVTPLQ